MVIWVFIGVWPVGVGIKCGPWGCGQLGGQWGVSFGVLAMGVVSGCDHLGRPVGVVRGSMVI